MCFGKSGFRVLFAHGKTFGVNQRGLGSQRLGGGHAIIDEAGGAGDENAVPAQVGELLAEPPYWVLKERETHKKQLEEQAAERAAERD